MLLGFERLLERRIQKQTNDNRHRDNRKADILTRDNIIKPNQEIEERLGENEVEKFTHNVYAISSIPPFAQGLQRSTRQSDRRAPRQSPWRRIARRAYSEQVG